MIKNAIRFLCIAVFILAAIPFIALWAAQNALDKPVED